MHGIQTFVVSIVSSTPLSEFFVNEMNSQSIGMQKPPDQRQFQLNSLYIHFGILDITFLQSTSISACYIFVLNVEFDNLYLCDAMKSSRRYLRSTRVLPWPFLIQ